jgi:hypothetical protein
MERADYLFGLITLNMKDNSAIIILKALELTLGLTVGPILGIGETTKCMERVFLLGQIVERYTKVNTETIKNMGMEK